MLRKAQERVAELGLTQRRGPRGHGRRAADVSRTTRSTWWWRNMSSPRCPNPEATLDEFARVLKPGGEIVLVSRVGAEAGLRARARALVRAGRAQLGWRTEFPWERYARWAARHAGHAPDRAPRRCRRSAISRSSASPRSPTTPSASDRIEAHAADGRTSHGRCAAASGCRHRVSPNRNITRQTPTNKDESMAGFLEALRDAALGRPPLLPSQPHQPVAAPGQRDRASCAPTCCCSWTRRWRR